MDLLRKSPEPRIVNVSVGSLTLQSDPNWMAYDFAKYAVCPGYTKTDFTGYNGGEVEEAGKRIIKYALLDKDGVTGKFISEATNPTYP